MPLPSPRKGEGREDFVVRFMASGDARAEFPDQEQRAAVAFQKWRDKMSKAVAFLKSLMGRPLQPDVAEEIVDAEVTKIALCRQGKNRIRPLLKSDGTFQMQPLVKAAPERGEVLAVVYAPDRLDDDGNFATADIIKSMAHGYLRDHRKVNIEHAGDLLKSTDAFIAESFIVGKGDERFAGWKNYDGSDAGDLAGAWAVNIQLANPVLRKAWADGLLDGVSLEGQAAVREVPIHKSAAEEIEMDESKLKEILGGFKTEMIALVKSTLAEALPKKEPKVDEPKVPEITKPVFKGSAANPEDLRNFAVEMRNYELNQKLAKGELTAADVIEMAKAAAAGEPTDAEAGVESADNDEVKGLKRALFKARKRTNAPESGSSDTHDIDLAKANADEGREIAKMYNTRFDNSNPLFAVRPRNG